MSNHDRQVRGTQVTARPVFVGGVPGSGCTLLTDLLGTHRGLSPVYETDFLAHLARLLAGPGTLRETAERVWRIVDTWSDGLPMPRHQRAAPDDYVHGPHYLLFDRGQVLDATLELVRSLPEDRVAGFRRFVVTLFTAHAALDGKPRWVNETPGLVASLPFVRRAFPDLLFVHVVRDGRELAASATRRSGGPRTWNEAAHLWRGQVSSVRAFAAQHPGAVHEVRLEDLLDDPVRTLDGVLRQVGVEGAGELVNRWHTAGGVLRPDRSRQQQRPAAADQAAFDAVAGEWLTRLGYRTGVESARAKVAVGA